MTGQTHDSKQPPREWFEGMFVHNGTVTYCSCCYKIPFALIGHDCTNPIYRLGGEWVTKPYRWEDVRPIENDDRPGDWAMLWVGP